MRIFIIKNLIFLMMLVPSLMWGSAHEDMEKAIVRRDAKAIIGLINSGMDINTVDKSGNTLLIHVIRHDIPDAFEFFLQRKAHFNARNHIGESALSIAAFLGRFNYVKRLVEAGADVNFYGWSPLTYAAFNGHAEIIEYLLKHGAEIDSLTPNGSSALFFAALNGHKEVVELLLKNGIDVSITSDRGETAVDLAEQSRNTDIAGMIRNAGGRSGRSMTLELKK